MSTARPAPGTPVVFRWRKWDGSPHWHHDCHYLGEDQWGTWLGQAVGQHSERPGRRFDVDHDNVSLIPHSGRWSMSANLDPNPDNPTAVYIDIAWDVEWGDDGPVGIDMDLDVVRSRDARGTWLDDEDEWVEHSVRYGYPTEVMTTLEAVAGDLLVRVADEQPPFDRATIGHWLAELDRLTRR